MPASDVAARIFYSTAYLWLYSALLIASFILVGLCAGLPRPYPVGVQVLEAILNASLVLEICVRIALNGWAKFAQKWFNLLDLVALVATLLSLTTYFAGAEDNSAEAIATLIIVIGRYVLQSVRIAALFYSRRTMLASDVSFTELRVRGLGDPDPFDDVSAAPGTPRTSASATDDVEGLKLHAGGGEDSPMA